MINVGTTCAVSVVKQVKLNIWCNASDVLLPTIIIAWPPLCPRSARSSYSVKNTTRLGTSTRVRGSSSMLSLRDWSSSSNYRMTSKTMSLKTSRSRRQVRGPTLTITIIITITTIILIIIILIILI